MKNLFRFLLILFISYAGTLYSNAEQNTSGDSCVKNDDGQTGQVSNAVSSESEVKADLNLPQGQSVENKQEYDRRVVEHLQNAKAMKMRSRDIVEAFERFSPTIASFLKMKIFGTYVVLLVMGFFVIVIGWLVWRFILSWAFRIASRRGNQNEQTLWKEVLSRLKSPIRCMVIIISTGLAIALVVRDKTSLIFLGRIVDMLFALVSFWAVGIFIDTALTIAEKRFDKKFPAARNLFDLCRRIAKYLIIVICILVVLDTFGINVDAIIASLGIGGAALAFASKDTIANFFGSVSIIADRQFAVGDIINAGGIEGTVENLGLRSTRIRTYAQTLVSIPNSVLANESIENLTRRVLRKAQMVVGLTYSTTPEQMRAIIRDFKEILTKDKDVDDSSVRVNFSGFGDSALEVTIVFYVMKIDIMSYSEVMERINLEILRIVNERHLSFAFPSRSIYVESMPK